MRRAARGIKLLFSVLFVSFMLTLPVNLLELSHEHGVTFNASADSQLTKLGDGRTQATITFDPGGGSDTSTKLTLPKRSEVLTASFELTGMSDDFGVYPTGLILDVGDDGDSDWEFNLSGAGALGKQTEFVGGLHSKLYRLDQGGYDNSIYLRLPRTANVVSAVLDIEGRHHGVPNGNFSTGTMVGWTTVTNQYSDTVTVSSARGGNNPPGGWGATGPYLMLRSNPFNSNDVDCNLRVESDYFPRFATNYITMDWDLVEHDNFNLWIRVYDENNNFVTARAFGGDNNNDHSETTTGQVIDIRSLTGQNLKIALRLWDGDAIDLFYDDWGRIAVDTIYISDPGGNPLPDHPEDVGVDIGDDGTKEFTAQKLVGSMSWGGLAGALNSILANPSPSCQLTIDDFGNEYLDIPLNVSVLSSPGLINLTNLEVVYDWTARVEKSPGGGLAAELNSHIPTSGSGNITIPISISSSSGGRIMLSGIIINYNAVPQSQTIPTIRINEDSLNPKTIDLDLYFSDDSPAGALSYEIAQNSAPAQLEAYVEDGHFLTLNAHLVPDWYGNVTLVVRAADEKGLSVESNPVTVQVAPVNDEPRPNILMDKYSLIEDGEGLKLPLNTIPYFIDPEGDRLYYHAESIDDGVINLSIEIENDNILNIRPGKDFNGYSIPIWLYCDDDADIDTNISSPHQVFTIDIMPVNDPPGFINLDTLHLDEDVDMNDWMHVHDIIFDVETPDDELVFSIVSNDNSENINVSVDDNDYIDITLPTRDYVGIGRVKFRVVDEEGAATEASLKIQVNPENDGPRIMKYPGKVHIREDGADFRTLNLYEIFYDPDSPNLYSYEGNEHITVTFFQDNGSIMLKPEKNWFGYEAIRFTATDTYLELDLTQKYATLVVNVTVIPENDPPGKPLILSPLEPRSDPGDPTVTFIAADGSDVDSDSLEYYWDFDNMEDSDGDGDPGNDRDGTGKMVVHKYPASGYYYAMLRVNDGELNCTDPAGVYVKVTTDYDKVSDEINENAGGKMLQVLYLIPFILIVILLIILFVILRRKMIAEENERKEKEKAESAPGTKPPVLDGEVVSESSSAPAASEALPGPLAGPVLPPAPVAGSGPGGAASEIRPTGAPGGAEAPTPVGYTKPVQEADLRPLSEFPEPRE